MILEKNTIMITINEPFVFFFVFLVWQQYAFVEFIFFLSFNYCSGSWRDEGGPDLLETDAWCSFTNTQVCWSVYLVPQQRLAKLQVVPLQDGGAVQLGQRIPRPGGEKKNPQTRTTCWDVTTQ